VPFSYRRYREEENIDQFSYTDEIAKEKQRIMDLWGQFKGYARQIEQASDKYWNLLGNHGPDTYEQVKGLEDWVVRTKGSYESKLWEMEVLLNHLSADNVVGYLGYDTNIHPDVSIVNRRAGTAVASETKQVESQDPKQVHVNRYAALDQLWKRLKFDNATLYTRWKMYIYINSGNPWPWTKLADNGKDYKTLINEKANEQKKTVHWTDWKNLAGSYKVEVSIWHSDYGRADYILEP
jgi:hypothetical protein